MDHATGLDTIYDRCMVLYEKRKYTLMKSIVLMLFLYFVCPVWAQSLAYRNPILTPEERAEDLLKRMTLEEKVGQLLCPMGWTMYDKQETR